MRYAFRYLSALVLTVALLAAATAAAAVVQLAPELSPAPTPAVPPEIPDVQRLGLHVTAAELAVWRDRARNGPYAVDGDAYENSPGDWTRITRTARLFADNPARYTWEGPSYDWPGTIINRASWPRNSLDAVPGKKDNPGSGVPVRDAAFRAMVTGDHDVLPAVKRSILASVRSKYLDFGNETRFSRDRFGTGYHPAYQIARWLTQVTFAWDYSRIADPGLWSAAEDAEFRGWLHEAGEWYAAQTVRRRHGMCENGTGACVPTSWADEPADAVVYSGGPRTEKVQRRFNNHVPRLARVATIAGIVNDDEALIDVGRQWVLDFLSVGVSPDGWGADFYRWQSGEPTKGWKYTMENLGATLSIADMLARTGDTSLYEHTTSLGTSATAGAKDYGTFLRQMVAYIDHDTGPTRFACNGCSDIQRRIDSRDEPAGINRAQEWTVTFANLYFRDPYVSRVMTRSEPGTPDLPEHPRHGQGWIYGGDHGVFPGVNLMWNGLEGKVWPFPVEQPG